MGSIYFIQAVTGGPVKIGYATNTRERMRDLQVGSPVWLVLLCSMAGERADEKAMHCLFAADAMQGEWFAPSDAIRAKVKELGGEVREASEWTSRMRLTKSARSRSSDALPPSCGVMSAVLGEGGSVAEAIRANVHRSLISRYLRGKRVPGLETRELLHVVSDGRIANDGWFTHDELNAKAASLARAKHAAALARIA